MNIDDLNNPSISEMSEEELLDHLNKIRSNRRKQPASKSKSAQTGGKKTSKKKDSKQKMLENLTAEERRKLLEDLDNENGSS